jgi:hypothetical protein
MPTASALWAQTRPVAAQQLDGAGIKQDIARDAELGAVQVQVAPAQRHDLTTAQPGSGTETHEQLELGITLGGRRHQHPRLLGCG